MRVIHDNWGSLLVNARELALAVQDDREMKNLLSCVTITQGGMLSDTH